MNRSPQGGRFFGVPCIDSSTWWCSSSTGAGSSQPLAAGTGNNPVSPTRFKNTHRVDCIKTFPTFAPINFIRKIVLNRYTTHQNVDNFACRYCSVSNVVFLLMTRLYCLTEYPTLPNVFGQSY
jgi:hypothetical protein